MTPRNRFLCALALLVLAAVPVFASEEAAADPGWGPSIAKFVNFAVLAAGVAYFARGPISDYLRSRATTIKKDLVDAKALRFANEQTTAEAAAACSADRLLKMPS